MTSTANWMAFWMKLLAWISPVGGDGGFNRDIHLVHFPEAFVLVVDGVGEDGRVTRSCWCG